MSVYKPDFGIAWIQTEGQLKTDTLASLIIKPEYLLLG